MTPPLISVAIPAYKVKYIRETIDSVLGQTYYNIELIIVNDQSPEPIKAVVDEYSDPRIKYYENGNNLGGKDPADNWNRCLEHANGEYFSLLCDDDVYEPDFLELMLSLARLYPQCGVFRARAKVVDASGKVTDVYPSAPQWETAEDYMWHVFSGYRRQTISEFFYRTDHIRSCGGYAHLPLAWNADYLSTFIFGKEGGLASVNDLLVSFRMSGDNISSQADCRMWQKLYANKQMYEAVKRQIQGNFYPELLTQSLERWKYHLDRDLLTSLTYGRIWEVFKKRKIYGLSIELFVKCFILKYADNRNKKQIVNGY